MRITKKWLRQQRTRLNRRMKELSSMTFDQLLTEVNRMFPGMELTPDIANDSFLEYGKLLNIAMQWAIECAFPSHLVG